ncbi:TetR/AcrR family transcriptional regulator [Actinophytocola sediminis]
MTTDRRTLIADAAIATLAADGMRGLTHRAVDRTAGLAEGSTSYYFRTREALIFAVLARLAEQDAEDIGELSGLDAPPTPDGLARLMAGLVRRWLTSGRTRTLARYELTLESTRRPRLRARLVEHGVGFVAMAEKMLAAAGADEPRRRADELTAFLDGLLYYQLVGVGADAFDDDRLLAVCQDVLALAFRRA